MFWDSVVAGLKVLTYWQVYVAGLEYFAIFFIPMIAVGLITQKSEGVGGTIGCLSMFLLPVLQVAAMAVFILTLSPIIFGFAEDAAWSFPWKVIMLAPGVFFKLIGVLVVAAIVLAFIPILGELQSLQTLVLGGIALMFVLAIFDSINPGMVKEHVDFSPNFWFSIGLLAIGGLMSWIGRMVAALLSMAIETAQEGLGQLIMFPIAAIFGFIPVFIYGAWLGTQIRGGF
ncbi:MAG: hypothetical protein CV087_22925 [Candidatus Brocadia sp. WS118]|nr:MAG: hypothetical protein CV087_22925 [Candidatus Brocadia sp. WS118]